MKEGISNTVRIKDKALFLAIDGGGTKTSAVLFTPDGNVAAAASGKSTNPNLLTDLQLSASFSELFEELGRKQRGNPPSPHRTFAGIAGAYNPDAGRRAENVLRSLLPDSCGVSVGHDGINALWSGAEGESGIAVIAGTGSIIFGMNGVGRQFRIGGWGHLISDDGSGYDMGRMALRAVMDAYDDTGPVTVLTGMVLEKLGCDSPPDIIPLVYKGGKALIASLSGCVLEAFQQSDRTAQAIVDDTCSKLASMLKAGISRAYDAGGWERPYRIVLTGGLWNSPIMKSAFVKIFDGYPMELKIIIPALPPVYGAARYLTHLMGIKTGKEFFERFYASFEKDAAKDGEVPDD